LLNGLPCYNNANSECHAKDHPYEGDERRPVECLAPGEAGAKGKPAPISWLAEGVGFAALVAAF